MKLFLQGLLGSFRPGKSEGFGRRKMLTVNILTPNAFPCPGKQTK